MKEKLTDIYNKILGSLDNEKNKGFSARKLAGVTVMVLVVVLHIKWFKSNHWEYTAAILGLDFGFIGLCLGLTTYQAMKEKPTITTSTFEQEVTDTSNKTSQTTEKA